MRTRVGYAGGTTTSPTYRSIGDHTETIQIDFDPTVVTFAELLAHFFDAHSPTAPEWSRQYRSVILYADEEQRRLAEEAIAGQALRHGVEVHTALEPLGEFTRAEAYHQKYYLRRMAAVERDFEAMYPDVVDLTDSTAAARVNGYAGGHGTLAQFDEELPSLGLSDGAARAMRERLAR